MSDASQQPAMPAVSPPDTRTLAIVVYGLYIGAVVTCGLAGLVGVILAYVKRDESRGTIWESHFDNAIQAFWIWLALFAVGVATAWFVIGIFVIGAGVPLFPLSHHQGPGRSHRVETLCLTRYPACRRGANCAPSR
ncbi:MAG: hypothetical protein WDM81_01485 [Rhizomicrobium sp.]